MRIGFIGAGVVGTALAVSLSRAGYEVVAVSSRTRSSAERLASLVPSARVCEIKQEVVDSSDLVFITTPDDVIEEASSEARWGEGKTAVHTSGALSLDVLRRPREEGARVGSLHPLQTFASLEEALENLPGSAFSIEGEEEVREV